MVRWQGGSGVAQAGQKICKQLCRIQLQDKTLHELLIFFSQSHSTLITIFEALSGPRSDPCRVSQSVTNSLLLLKFVEIGFVKVAKFRD